MTLESCLEEARRIAKDVVAGEVESIEAYNWPEKTMRALQDAGLMGLNVPEEWGGHGLGLEALAKVAEVLGYESGSAGLCFGMHCVGTAVLASKATDDHGERYLRPIAEGKHITTLALSEPGTGVHFYLPQLRLTKTDDGYTVSGRKSFITNGGHADSYVLSAFAEDGDLGEFTCLMVPNEGKGLKWNGPWSGLGMRGNSSIELDLEDFAIPANDRLGDDDDQIWYVFNVVAPYFLVAMGGTYLGIAQRALDEALDHVQNRIHDHTGRALGDQDVIQHHISRMWARVEMARQLIYNACLEAEAGSSKALPSIMAAKIEIAECAVDVVNQALTVCGGMHYREGSLLERLLRDARAADVMAPTTDVLRLWMGRALLNRPMLVE